MVKWESGWRRWGRRWDGGEGEGDVGMGLGEEMEPGFGVVGVSSRGGGMNEWEREWERCRSLWWMHRLAMMTQYRLGVRYREQVEMLGLVAKIELALISMGETLPEPGMEWDGDRRMREVNRRVSRLLWVEREQMREYGGVKGIVNWLVGRRRMSAKEMVERMVVEADGMMGLMPVGGGMVEMGMEGYAGGMGMLGGGDRG